jgi:sulfite exporter TauE/SafE/copper chaperone CopZ
MQSCIIKIKGMHCRSCEILVEDELLKIPGASRAEVDFHKGTAKIYYKNNFNESLVGQAIKNAGYEVGQSGPTPFFSSNVEDYQELGVGVLVVIALFVLGKITGILDVSVGAFGNYSSLPVVLLIGLTAGISTCMALVGGPVLSLSAKLTQEHPEATAVQRFIPHLLFNLGRILGFAFFGAIIGLIGSAFQLSTSFTGIIVIFSGLVMGFMGLQLVGIFPRLHSFSLKLPIKINSISNPFFLGALTFFLPCGFTQAIQAYAMTMGNPITSAMVLAVFALGTAPGLLGIGGLTAWIKGETARIFFKTVGLVVVVLAVLNIKGGLLLTGFQLPKIGSEVTSGPSVEVVNGVQIVKMRQVANGYVPQVFNIKRDIPVKWIITSESSYTCAASLVVPKLGIRKYLEPGENIIEFTPKDSGRLGFSCSMGMYSGSFNVI